MDTLLSLYHSRLSDAEPGKTVLTVVDSRLQAYDLEMTALDEFVSRAAGCLRTLGCGKGSRVLISLRGSLQVFAFFWGAVKCGAVPCVLFPGLGAGGLSVRLNAADADFFCYGLRSGKTDRRGELPSAPEKSDPAWKTVGCSAVPQLGS